MFGNDMQEYMRARQQLGAFKQRLVYWVRTELCGLYRSSQGHAHDFSLAIRHWQHCERSVGVS